MIKDNPEKNPPLCAGRSTRPHFYLWLGLVTLLVVTSAACNFSATMRFLATPMAMRMIPSQQSRVPTLAPIQLPPLAVSTPSQPAGQAVQPDAEIVQLANDAAMTAKGMELFYSARPQIDTDRATFERDCRTQVMRNSVELGCYTNDNRIFILRITDANLRAEMTVIAAHEMLHVAYAQLSTAEQSSLDAGLENVVSGIQDPDLLQRLKTYRTLEPGQRDNELHSILGTEYPTLGTTMETYYSLYFSDDRRAVVSAADQFNQIFSRKETELTNLQIQIKTLRRQMQAARAQQNDNEYNQLVPQINDLIKQYNQAVRDYNALSRQLIGEVAPEPAP